jgi:hypothetical protein
VVFLQNGRLAFVGDPEAYRQYLSSVASCGTNGKTSSAQQQEGNQQQQWHSQAEGDSQASATCSTSDITSSAFITQQQQQQQQLDVGKEDEGSNLGCSAPVSVSTNTSQQQQQLQKQLPFLSSSEGGGVQSYKEDHTQVSGRSSSSNHPAEAATSRHPAAAKDEGDDDALAFGQTGEGDEERASGAVATPVYAFYVAAVGWGLAGIVVASLIAMQVSCRELL